MEGLLGLQLLIGGMLIIVHFAFLYKIWSELGFLWALGGLLIPFFTWLVTFFHWRLFRSYFLAELGLSAAFYLLTGGLAG